MISIPSILNTRADYDRALSKAKKGEQPAAHVLPHFIGLRDNRYHYVFDKHLANDEQPTGQSPDFIVLHDSESEQITQLKREEMKDALIYKLGYTVKEVTQIINELEALQ